MIRLYVPGPLAAGQSVAMTPEASRYLTAVMRLGAGDGVHLFNGRDGEWRAVLAAATKRGCVLDLVEQTRPLSLGPDLDLIAAVVKRPRLETIVEKAAELGARRVRLCLTRRTNDSRPRLERLEAIATEAAEQTGRLDVPEIHPAQPLATLLDGWEPGRRLLFCDEGGDAPPASAALAATGGEGPWSVLIGPEGGFAPEERERLRAEPFTVPASLGPRILRADTAAVSALTLWLATLGDWRGA